RYLLVSRRKVTSRTVRVFSIALFIRLVIGALLRAQVAADGPSLDHPLWVLGAATEVFMVLVIIWGVLRHSKPAWIVCTIGLVIVALSLITMKLAGMGKLPWVHLDGETTETLVKWTNGIAIGGGVVIALAMFFGSLRAYFTFFTTVPIGGVW